MPAKAILAVVRPPDLAGKTWRRLAAQQLAELVAVDRRIKALTKELEVMVLARRLRLMDQPGTEQRAARCRDAEVGVLVRAAGLEQ